MLPLGLKAGNGAVVCALLLVPAECMHQGGAYENPEGTFHDCSGDMGEVERIPGERKLDREFHAPKVERGDFRHITRHQVPSIDRNHESPRVQQVRAQGVSDPRQADQQHVPEASRPYVGPPEPEQAGSARGYTHQDVE